MAFCSNCGVQLQEEAKFCSECGTPVTGGNSKTAERKTVYEGEVHKCPKCGEILNSFVPVCASCGYELRGKQENGSVKEFAEKIEAIEKQKELIKQSLAETETLFNSRMEYYFN